MIPVLGQLTLVTTENILLPFSLWGWCYIFSTHFQDLKFTHSQATRMRGKKGRERVLGGGGDESINICYVCYLNWVKGTARRRQHGVGRKEICTLLSPICKNTKLQIVALRMKTSKQVTAWTLCLQPDYPHQATNDIIIIIVKKQVWMSLQSGERYMQAKIPKRLFTNLYLPLLMATWEEQGNVLKWTELQVLSSCQI